MKVAGPIIDFQTSGALALLEHLPRAERCVTLFYHPLVLDRIVSGVMQEVTREDFDPRTLIHLHALVDVRPEPAAARFAIEAQLPIGIPATAANPPSHVKGAPRDRISIGKLRFVCGSQPLDRVSQLIG